ASTTKVAAQWGHLPPWPSIAAGTLNGRSHPGQVMRYFGSGISSPPPPTARGAAPARLWPSGRGELPTRLRGAAAPRRLRSPPADGVGQRNHYVAGAHPQGQPREAPRVAHPPPTGA